MLITSLQYAKLHKLKRYFTGKPCKKGHICERGVCDRKCILCKTINHLRAVRKKQTPVWADKQAIKDFYLECPPHKHVDHIIPLRGKLVSGLHVHTNLQYLTKRKNLSKSSYFNPMRFKP